VDTTDDAGLDKVPADEWLAPFRDTAPAPAAAQLEHEYRQRRFMLPIRDWLSRATKRSSPPKQIGEQ
jgi:hypothetical protein